MAEIKILKHSAVIIGTSFEDCRTEWDRIVNGVEKDFSTECNLKNWMFSSMTEREGECIAVFAIPEYGIIKTNSTDKIPLNIKARTIENMEVYHMVLLDAFEEAVKTLAEKGTDLYNAWYYGDFRKYIPEVYDEKYLDFEKYPLKY